MHMAEPPVPPHQSTTWPGRFNVRAEIRYRSRRKGAGVMQVILYQPALPEADCADILADAGFVSGNEAWSSLVSQAKDTFSFAESEALVNYLNTREGTSAHRYAAKLPTPGLIGASAIPTLPSFRDGIVDRLHTQRGYSLPFKVEAVNVKIYLHMTRLYNEFRSTIQ
jgi:hypothetical protein